MKVAILGSGAYGLALASRLLMNKNDVEMWTYSKEEKKQLKETRISSKLPNYKIPKEIKITKKKSTSTILRAYFVDFPPYENGMSYLLFFACHSFFIPYHYLISKNVIH